MSVGNDVPVFRHDDAGAGAVHLHGVFRPIGLDADHGGPDFCGNLLGRENAIGVFFLIGSRPVLQ